MAKQKQYTQKFRSAWLKDPILKDWLITVESTDGLLAKCKYCESKLTCRYADLKAHGETKKHKKNMRILCQGQVKIPFKKQSEQLESKKAEARYCLFVATHTSINIIDHLIMCCHNSITDSKIQSGIQMHRTKCSNIIKNVIAPHFLEDLKNDIEDSGFSLLIDESTDISVNKYLGIVIIYYSKKHNNIITTYLDLVELVSGNADAIIDSIKFALNKYNLSLKNMIGLATDNASVMTGVNNGVHKKLQEENPCIILIKCVCHSIQLAVSHASKETLPRSLEFLIQETYNWFANSTIRQKSYQQLYNLINENHDPLKIVRACQTRWLSIETAVTRIYAQWIELKEHFKIARVKEKCYTAELLYQMYNNDINYAFLGFLKPILVDVQRVNKLFESADADPTKLLDELQFLIDGLISKITIPEAASNTDIFNSDIALYIDKNCSLGYGFEKTVKDLRAGNKLTQNDEADLRQRCIDFVVALIKEIKCRLPDNIKILKQISSLSVSKALCHNKPNLLELGKLFQINEEIYQNVESQWQKIHLLKWGKIHNTKAFWLEVRNFKDAVGENPFSNLANFAIKVLCLPYSNAEVERLFSCMNIIKTKIRNKMQLPMLSSIISIRYGLKRQNQCCHSYDLPLAVVRKIKTNEAYNNNQNQDQSDADIIFPLTEDNI